MPSIDTLLVFVAAGLLFALMPGPAVVYIVTRGVDQGRTAGVVSALGIETGNLVHVTAATAGLSTLLWSSALAFAVVKYAGAAYLIYLGVRRLLERVDEADEVAAHKQPRSRLRLRLYVDGVAVAILNPKTALFFLAFLPQFVEPSQGAAAPQVAVLGMLLVAVTTVGDTCYALLAGTASRWLRSRQQRSRRRWISGGVYIMLGCSAALADAGPRSAASPQ